MPAIENTFFSETKSFINNNELLCLLTLGMAIVIYATGNLMGRTVSWLSECFETSEETDVIGRKTILETTTETDRTLAGIPVTVRTALDLLFEGSPYSLNELPIYAMKEGEDIILRANMTAPVMKGIVHERPFIAIKVQCDLSDDNIKQHAGCDEVRNYYKSHRQLNHVLILYQYSKEGPLYWGGDGKFAWDQLGRGQSMTPSFFTWNFTYADDGTGPTRSQTENFKLAQTLLKEGTGPDTNGLIWHITK